MGNISLQSIENTVFNFIESNALNEVPELSSLKIYDRPLIGVASADDPLFSLLKGENVVGPHHLLPHEWLDGAKSVVSYFLPFTKKIREANRVPGVVAREWLSGRIEGELCNNALREHLVQEFLNKGIQAVSPGIDNRFRVVNRRSNWSERHVAFIAGLGTFSLSRSLITRKGSAGRIGSIIVDIQLEPTVRKYQDRDEYCTKCGACILRCPPFAISEAGKDNAVCGDYLDRVLARFRPRYGCGKCQTGVPCENKIPG
jgi:epoxyqueuosine reductase